MTFEEFQTRLVAFAGRAVSLKERCVNEESTKLFLVLPFINLLGYDDRDPNEVYPEHHADFSEKYKNRVDYAVMHGNQPAMAVECKTVGNSRKDDRGQLKSYYNACKSVKLGILTDGLQYDFFVDSNEPNLMDEDPFLSIELERISNGELNEGAVKVLFSITKANFDPDTIAENARMGLAYKLLFDDVSRQLKNPDEDFTRYLLQRVQIKNVRKNLDQYQALAKTVFTDVFNEQILKRLELAPSSTASAVASVAPDAPHAPIPLSEPKVETTEVELAFYDYVRRRMSFMSAGDNALFEGVSKIQFHDFVGKFVIYYEMERKGRLLEFREGKDGVHRIQIADGGEEISTSDFGAVDGRLFSLFRARVTGKSPPSLTLVESA